MVLDVVYNHVGASGVKALEAFGPYFTEKYETPGAGDQLRRRALRRRARVGAARAPSGWVRDFHLDGLRLDAIHAIVRLERRAPRAEVAARACTRHEPARAGDRRESALNDPKVMRPPERGGWGCDAAWADDFHHALRVLLTGERDGYYAEFGSIAELAKAFHRPHVHDGGYSTFRRRRFGAPAEDVPPERFVVFARTTTRSATARFGDRLPARGAAARRVLHAAVPVHADAVHGRGVRRAGAVPVLLRPHRPGDRRRDARGAPARVRGVRGVLRRGGARTRRIPPPSSARSSRARRDPELRELYAELLRAARASCRRATPTRSLRRATPAGCGVRRGGCSWSANFADRAVHVPARADAEVVAGHARADGRARATSSSRRSRGRWCVTEVWPGRPFPLGADLGRRRARTSRSSPSTPSGSSCACSTTDDDEDARRADRAHRAQLALLPARRRAGPALRLPRPRARTSPSSGPPLQPGQAAARPVREGDRRRRSLGRGQRRCPYVPDAATRTPTSSPTTRTTPDAIPKSVVIDPRFDWEGDRPPSTPLAETVIYETHVKGFTKRHPECARTCAAPTPGSPPTTAIGYLQGARRHRGRAAAGPPHRRRVVPRRARPDELLGLQLRSASSPRTRAYAATGQRGQEVREFKGMVKALHRAGIEVILDVVYNHTAEGNHLGPMLSFKGVDNAVLLPARARRPAPLHGLHGHRQHAQRPCTRACCG